MKRKTIITILALMITFVGIRAGEINKDENITEVDSDSIILDGPDVIKMRAIGRYDRGIMNYRFIPKGKFIFGVTASYANYDSSDIQFLDFLQDFNAYGRVISVNPFLGYAIKNNTTLGMKLGYEQISANLDNISIVIDDLDLTLKEMYYSQDLYALTLFHRSYVGLDPGKRFGLFNETNLSYAFGDTRFTRGKSDDLETFEDVITRINQLRLGINPGITVFIMENVSVECSFGVVGFKYRDEKQKTNNVESGSRRTSGANFKINLLNISLGLTICM